jgi:hypothetical protein
VTAANGAISPTNEPTADDPAIASSRDTTALLPPNVQRHRAAATDATT